MKMRLYNKNKVSFCTLEDDVDAQLRNQIHYNFGGASYYNFCVRKMCIAEFAELTEEDKKYDHWRAKVPGFRLKDVKLDFPDPTSFMLKRLKQREYIDNELVGMDVNYGHNLVDDILNIFLSLKFI